MSRFKAMMVLRPMRRTSPASREPRLSRQDSLLPVDDASFPIAAAIAADDSRLTFFDLAPELRNYIYETIATTTVLSLAPSRKTSSREKAAPPPVCGLLLASRQCRREFLPLFFATATVLVDIKDFDFRNLMRVVGSLYRTELKAIRENPTARIRLWTNNCAREHLLILRRWLQHRANAMDRLPWQYEIALMPTLNVVGKIRQMRELEYYRRKLTELHSRLDENLQWELQAIIQAFEVKTGELEDELQHVDIQSALEVRRGLRGIAGGGVV